MTETELPEHCKNCNMKGIIPGCIETSMQKAILEGDAKCADDLNGGKLSEEQKDALVEARIAKAHIPAE